MKGWTVRRPGNVVRAIAGDSLVARLGGARLARRFGGGRRRPSPDGRATVNRVMADNLELLATVLETADIPYFVVPTESPHRYRVGVPETFRSRTFQALRALEDPSVRVRLDAESGAKTVVPAMGPLRPALRRKAMRAPAWRVYRPVDNGTWVLGHGQGCEVEFWPFDQAVPERLWNRRWNKRGHVLSRDTATTAELTVGGRTYPTGEVFVAGPHVDEVTFPVDLVYTWVDGDDPDWVAGKNAVLDRLDLTEHTADANDPSRYRDHDELRYSLRSVAEYADFVRHIFIVTDGQVPSWLDTNHERVTVVDHTEIFPSPDYLPTFNSHAIESCLHRIPGLAEHYLYLNDDFFFGRRVTPAHFFHGNGMTKFFLSPALIGGGDPSNTERSVDAAATNTRRLIYERFGRVVSQKLKHAPYPQRRSVLYEMEDLWREEFAGTAASQIRGPQDVPVPSSLFHYYAYITGRGVPGNISSSYVSLGDRGLGRRLRALRRRERFDVLCVNDSSGADPDGRHARRTAFERFMASYWPAKSPFER